MILYKYQYIIKYLKEKEIYMLPWGNIYISYGILEWNTTIWIRMKI